MKNKPRINHPNRTNFIVFYYESYNEEAMRGMHMKNK